jgi:hypothetical protein
MGYNSATVDDYRVQLVKDSIEGLAAGDYILIAQNKKLLDTLSDRLINKFVRFKVSGMVVAQPLLPGNINEFKVLESKDGLPVRGAKIEEEQRKSNAIFTNADGFASLTKSFENVNAAVVMLGRDSIAVSLNKSYTVEDEEETKVVLFTDRPIYRPGQEVL